SERFQELIEKGLIDPDDFDSAVRESHKSGEQLGKVLVRMGFVEEDEVLRATANSVGVEFMKLTSFQPPKELKELVPPRIAEHYNLIPISLEDGVLKIAVSDPLDIHTFDELRRMLGVEVEPV